MFYWVELGSFLCISYFVVRYVVIFISVCDVEAVGFLMSVLMSLLLSCCE